MIEFPNDLEGAIAPPRVNGELVFDQPWQRRLFATTMALCDTGPVTYEQFRNTLIATIAASSQPYWSSWQDAFERVLADSGLCDSHDIAARAAAFKAHP
jgi:hypothetical protein